MIIFVLVAAIGGFLLGMWFLWATLPAHLKRHIDYKQRWEDAVKLLGTQGSLTDEQVKQITTKPRVVSTGQHPARTSPSPVRLNAALRSMASWDRKDIEVERAKNGLPPVDDLTGMASWDKAAVLKARAKYGTE